MQTLALELTPVLGRDLDEMVRDGCRLAARLDLHHCNIKANDYDFTCYPNGTAQKWARKGVGRYTWDGAEWTFIPPIKGARP